MKYQALYRKYRPMTFDEIYGQEIVKKILINSINSNKIAHAYLFYGPRGTGKTSIAKMFARIVNCENNNGGKTCEKCNSCIQSKQKECIDIIEIDAASNNGVDEIRDLKNKINLVPNYLHYKVYIIDEVHMLSTGAFNALLKTLEEPPEHVIFILATTEIYEVPSTIISRCQLLEFKNIDNINLKNRLMEISDKENINIEETAVEEIVKNCDGGMRDAIGLLDKLNAFCENKITIDDVRCVLGVASITEISEFTELLINNDTDQLIKKVNLYDDSGQDLVKIIDEIIINLENRMLKANSFDYVDLVDELLNLQTKIYNTKNKKIVFNLYLMNKTNVRHNVTNNNENITLEDIAESAVNIKKEKTAYVDNKILEIRINNAFAGADKSILNEIKTKWLELEKNVFDSEIGSVVCDLFDSIPVVASKTNLMIATKYDSGAEKINLNLEKYENVVNNILGITNKIIAISTDDWEKQKKEYVKNLKDGITYNYIEDNTITITDEVINKDENKKNIKEKAKELFGDLVI